MLQVGGEEQLFMGIDCGTQSLRVCCLDKTGRVVCRATRDLRTSHKMPFWAEQSAEDWWKALIDATQEICQSRHIANNIASIGICGTSSTIVPCDLQMNPIAPAILWMDNRAMKEAEELRQLVKLAGLSREISSEHLAPKLLWLARHQRALLKGSLVECVSWLVFQLTGKLYISKSISNFLWGILPNEWAKLGVVGDEIAAILHVIDAPQALPTAIAGEVRPDVAALLGIHNTRHPVIVAIGGNDALLSAVGSGLLREDPTAVEIGGTSYVSIAKTNALPQVLSQEISQPITAPFEPNSWIILSSIETAGLFLNWLKKLLQMSAMEFEDTLRKIVRRIESGQYDPSSISVNINLLGEKRQINQLSGAGLANLNSSTTRGELLQASLETIAFMAWERMNRLSSLCQPTPKQVFVAGGFSRNRAFLTLRASLEESQKNGLAIYGVEDKDVGCRGASMCGACAMGAFPSLAEASKSLAAPSHQIHGSDSVGRRMLAIKQIIS